MKVTINPNFTIDCYMNHAESEVYYGAGLPFFSRCRVHIDLENEIILRGLGFISYETVILTDFYGEMEELVKLFHGFSNIFEDASKFFLSSRSKYIFSMRAYSDE